MNKTVTIRGKVVDDETGKPIERLITQAGKFEPADPTKVTWGYSEGPKQRQGRLVFDDGPLGRGLDGPHPGRRLRSAAGDRGGAAGRQGRDRSHDSPEARPAGAGRGARSCRQTGKGAAVFAVGPTGLNLSAGQAWTSWGEKDNEAKPVVTDDAGRFEFPRASQRSWPYRTQASMPGPRRFPPKEK